MSATNVTRLRQRLEELLAALERFDTGLDNDFRALSVRWSQLDAAWDGYAYQEFVGSWHKSQNTIRQYVSLSKKFEQYLRERIEALKRFESSGGM